MATGQTFADEMSVNKMTKGKMSVEKMLADEMSANKITEWQDSSTHTGYRQDVCIQKACRQNYFW
jgi:hypothetical protein